MVHQQGNGDGGSATASGGAVELAGGVRHLVRLGVQPVNEVGHLAWSGRVTLGARQATPTDAQTAHLVRVIAAFVAQVDDVGDALQPKPEVAGAVQRRTDVQPRRNLTRAKRVASEDRAQRGPKHRHTHRRTSVTVRPRSAGCRTAGWDAQVNPREALT